MAQLLVCLVAEAFLCWHFIVLQDCLSLSCLNLAIQR